MLGGFPGGPHLGQAEISDPAVQSFLGGYEALRRADKVGSSDSPECREAVNGLTDFLEVERKRVPDQVLRDAERLECLLFSGYDPYFEGDEPPGL